MITITTTTRATGKVEEHVFKTELGAYSHVANMLHDSTNIPLTLCRDTAALLTDKQFRVRQKKFGPYLFTITR